MLYQFQYECEFFARYTNIKIVNRKYPILCVKTTKMLLSVQLTVQLFKKLQIAENLYVLIHL